MDQENEEKQLEEADDNFIQPISRSAAKAMPNPNVPFRHVFPANLILRRTGTCSILLSVWEGRLTMF